jgi:hypothetical protein
MVLDNFVVYCLKPPKHVRYYCHHLECSDFHGTSLAAPTPRAPGRSSGPTAASPLDAIPRSPAPSRKRESPPGGQRRRLRARSRRRVPPVSAFGNFRSRFPFAARRLDARRFRRARRRYAGFPSGLGSINPGASAVLREPFSTSAFEG